jgi:uncharacterized membrane protein YdjX (TVP38/TMEM64 family)
MQPAPAKRPSPTVVACAVAAIMAAAVATSAIFTDSLDFISLKTVGLNYATLKHWVEHQFGLSLLAYIAAYLLISALMMPGGAMLATLGGLLFGITIGFPLAVLASLLGASFAFLLARTFLAAPFRRANAKLIDRLHQGFQRHALGYMLSLRLAPGIPFGVINVAPAVIGVPFSTFFLGSALGFVPSRLALSTAGAGLGRVVEAENVDYAACLLRSQNISVNCPYKIDVSQLLTNEIVAAFVALSLLALLPAGLDALSRQRARRTNAKRKERPDAKG